MQDLITSLGAWGVPTIFISILVGIFIFMQITGEIIEWCGKTAPTWLKIRKKIQAKREAKRAAEAEREQALKDATKAIETFNQHYNPEAIKARNNWMNWVNERANVYDASVQDLIALKDNIEIQTKELQYNSELTSQLYKDFNRNRILDFAHDVVNARKCSQPVIYSREEFKKIHRIYEDYENFLARYGGTNGEVDDAMIVIRQAERGEIPNIEFLEDLRD